MRGVPPHPGGHARDDHIVDADAESIFGGAFEGDLRIPGVRGEGDRALGPARGVRRVCRQKRPLGLPRTLPEDAEFVLVGLAVPVPALHVVPEAQFEKRAVEAQVEAGRDQPGLAGRVALEEQGCEAAAAVGGGREAVVAAGRERPGRRPRLEAFRPAGGPDAFRFERLEKGDRDCGLDDEAEAARGGELGGVLDLDLERVGARRRRRAHEGVAEEEQPRGERPAREAPRVRRGAADRLERLGI